MANVLSVSLFLSIFNHLSPYGPCPLFISLSLLISLLLMYHPEARKPQEYTSGEAPCTVIEATDTQVTCKSNDNVAKEHSVSLNLDGKSVLLNTMK